MRAFAISSLLVLLCCSSAFGGFFGDVINAGVDVATGTINKIPDLIPTPEGIFETGKQFLAGYPFEVVSSAINKVCSIAASSDALKPLITPDIKNMSFLFMTPTKNYTYNLLDADDMWKSPAFDRSKDTVIFVTGWGTDFNETNDAITTMAKAHFCRGNVNFVVVDTARYVDTLYTWSAFNTEEIGENIAIGLIQLTNYVPLSKIQLIGHSLGAHIVGAAGRTFTFGTGKLIPRVTGLDPAKPCFNEGENLSGLQRGDADFIDIIHSNPGVLGKRDPMGDVDFYPGGLDPLPKGCISISCAHARAWEYYAETVYPGNENNFQGVRCSSLTRLKSNKCPGRSYSMGFAVPRDIKGNYFLEVNGKRPFGTNGKKNAQPRCNA